MSLYTIGKKGQEVKKVFSLGESLPSCQDPRVSIRTDAEDCFAGHPQSSAVLLNNSLEEKKKKLGNTLLESLSANSEEFPNSSELGLDNSYISPHNSPQTRSHQYITLYCSGCGYRYIAPIKCEKWRLCEHCRKRESYRLRSKYLKMINSFPREKLRLITVTTPNTEKLTRHTIQRIRGYWLKLLRWKHYSAQVQGGFYSIEVVNHGKDWNVHLHALVQVKHQNMLPGSPRGFRHTKAQDRLSKDWYRLTEHKAKIVSIRKVHSPSGSLGYILKYLSKSPCLTGINATQYLEALKSTRLLSLFGKWYSLVKKVISPFRFECPNCRNDSWVSQWFLRDIEEELNPARAP